MHNKLQQTNTAYPIYPTVKRHISTKKVHRVESYFLLRFSKCHRQQMGFLRVGNKFVCSYNQQWWTALRRVCLACRHRDWKWKKTGPIPRLRLWSGWVASTSENRLGLCQVESWVKTLDPRRLQVWDTSVQQDHWKERRMAGKCSLQRRFFYKKQKNARDILVASTRLSFSKFCCVNAVSSLFWAKRPHSTILYF